MKLPTGIKFSRKGLTRKLMYLSLAGVYIASAITMSMTHNTIGAFWVGIAAAAQFGAMNAENLNEKLLKAMKRDHWVMDQQHETIVGMAKLLNEFRTRFHLEDEFPEIPDIEEVQKFMEIMKDVDLGG